MNETGTMQKVSDWITMTFALVFIVFGIGILTRIFFPERLFMGGTLRIVFGVVVIAYGIIRILMIGNRLRRIKREKSLTKNA